MPDGNVNVNNLDGGMISSMLSLLAGGGFEKVAKGVRDLAQSGVDLTSFLSLPNMPIFMAGAFLKDGANSMELLNPIMKVIQGPSSSEEQQQDPAKIQAALAMLSARLGPGDTGLRLPPRGGMGASTGIGSPPPGMGIRPPGLPAAGPPMLGI